MLTSDLAQHKSLKTYKKCSMRICLPNVSSARVRICFHVSTCFCDYVRAPAVAGVVVCASVLFSKLTLELALTRLIGSVSLQVLIVSIVDAV